MSSTLRIENATIMTMGAHPRVLESHSLYAVDGIITRIEPGAMLNMPADTVIDGRRMIVMPGLINAHMHFYSTFARGFNRAAPSTDFTAVLNNLWWKLDRALTLEDCSVSALISCLNAIRHGTTTIIDHHASPGAVRNSLQAIAQSVNTAGLRACLCYEVSDRDGSAVTREGLEENAAFIRQCRSANDQHLKALFGLHASFTLSDATIRSAVELVRDLDSGFHLHVAEADADQQHALRRHGMRVVERLHALGVLGTRTIAAHGVHLTEAEMDLLATTGTAVVHNPQSNQNNAVGIADIIAMQERGITVGLGTDAMTVNMFEELRSALWGQHLHRQNPSKGFREVTAALFQNNPQIARAIWGIPLGEIAVGAPADVILLKYDAPTPLTDDNLFGHLLFGISQEPVDTTVVAGKVLMQHGHLQVDVDEERLAARARELAAAVWKTMEK